MIGILRGSKVKPVAEKPEGVAGDVRIAQLRAEHKPGLIEHRGAAGIQLFVKAVRAAAVRRGKRNFSRAAEIQRLPADISVKRGGLRAERDEHARRTAAGGPQKTKKPRLVSGDSAVMHDEFSDSLFGALPKPVLQLGACEFVFRRRGTQARSGTLSPGFGFCPGRTGVSPRRTGATPGIIGIHSPLTAGGFPTSGTNS